MQFRLFPAIALSLGLLVACGPTAVQYRITFDTQDPKSVEELTLATIRVIERRLDRLGAGLSEKNVIKDADGVTLELRVSDGSSAQTLTEELTSPFDLEMMLEQEDASTADITVEGIGSFVKTGVTGDDLVNVLASTNPETKGGVVRINFTDEGKAKMDAIFKENVGKDLGLFVRGRLVSMLTIMEPTLPNPLAIDGVPDPEIAEIFADDVNVGIHVTVTPL